MKGLRRIYKQSLIAVLDEGDLWTIYQLLNKWYIVHKSIYIYSLQVYKRRYIVYKFMITSMSVILSWSRIILERELLHCIVASHIY